MPLYFAIILSRKHWIKLSQTTLLLCIIIVLSSSLSVHNSRSQGHRIRHTLAHNSRGVPKQIIFLPQSAGCGKLICISLSLFPRQPSWFHVLGSAASQSWHFWFYQMCGEIEDTVWHFQERSSCLLPVSVWCTCILKQTDLWQLYCSSLESNAFVLLHFLPSYNYNFSVFFLERGRSQPFCILKAV